MLPKRMCGFFFVLVFLMLLVVDSFVLLHRPGTHWVSFAVLQELWGYRHGSLQNYDRLKAWLQEGEHKLKFIKAHLACTLAALQGSQVWRTLLGHVTVICLAGITFSYGCLSRTVEAPKFEELELELRPCIAHCDTNCIERAISFDT